jgi:Tol biopolymer transport system component
VLTLTNNLASNTDGQLTVVGRVVQSPDGTRLAFDARAGLGATRIYVASFSGSVVQPADRLTSLTEGQESFPTWVSDARVGFSSSAGGNDNVYTASGTVLRGSVTLAVPSAREPWFGPN